MPQPTLRYHQPAMLQRTARPGRVRACMCLWAVAASLSLGGCGKLAPQPPQKSPRPVAGAFFPTIDAVGCNVQMDVAQIDTYAWLEPLFGRTSSRYYAVPLDLGWDRIQFHYRQQLPEDWTLQKAARRRYDQNSVIWGHPGRPDRYLALTLLRREDCLAQLPYQLLLVAVPRSDAFEWR